MENLEKCLKGAGRELNEALPPKHSSHSTAAPTRVQHLSLPSTMRFSTLISAVSTAALAIGGTHAANVFKVRDITSNQLTARFGAGFTDLGIPVRTPDNRLLFVCGDTFNDRVGGPDWRSPIGLYSNNDINNVVINGAVGGGYARGMVPEGHAGGTTAIPSDVFAVGNKLYMHLQRGVIYKMVSRSSVLARGLG